MPTDLSVPERMLYKNPVVDLAGELNYVRYLPISGQAFRSTQSFTINVNSDTDMWDPTKTYLKANYRLIGATATAGSVCTSLGAISVIQGVQTTIGGRELDNIRNYNHYTNQLYRRAPPSQQAILTELEGFKDQDYVSATSAFVTNGRKFCHALRCGLLESDRVIPLAFIQGGVSFTIQLDDFKKALALNTNLGATDIEISEIELVCGLLRPSDKYLKDYVASLESGRPSQLPVGFHQSCRSILVAQVLNSNVNSATADEFALTTTNKLKSYQFTIGSQTYPKMSGVKVNTDNSVGAVDPESFMQMLVSLDNSWAHMSPPSNTSDTEQCIFYSWASSPNFASGIPTEAGRITMQLEFNSAPTAATGYVFTTVDCNVMIKANDVDIRTDEL